MRHQNQWRQTIDFVSKVEIAQHFAVADSMNDLFRWNGHRLPLTGIDVP